MGALQHTGKKKGRERGEGAVPVVEVKKWSNGWSCLHPGVLWRGTVDEGYGKTDGRDTAGVPVVGCAWAAVLAGI